MAGQDKLLYKDEVFSGADIGREAEHGAQSHMPSVKPIHQFEENDQCLNQDAQVEAHPRPEFVGSPGQDPATAAAATEVFDVDQDPFAQQEVQMHHQQHQRAKESGKMLSQIF